MTEKEFLKMINNADDRFLKESFDVFGNDVFEKEKEMYWIENIREYNKNNGKRRMLIKSVIYTAALLAVSVGVISFSQYMGNRLDEIPPSQTEVTSDNRETAAETGISQENGLVYGNLTLNNKTGSPIGGMICRTENGLYFSNPEDNEYIYYTDADSYFSGKKLELVLDMPARFLNYYGGKLYFISSSGKASLQDNVYAGYLYSLDTETGSCVKLTDSSFITGLTVTNEGIYYNTIPINGSSLDPPELWHTGFDGKNTEKCGYSYALRNGSYLIEAGGAYKLTEDRLNIAESGHIPLNTAINRSCVYDNKLLSLSDNTVYITDLLSGETNEYKYNPSVYYSIKDDFEITDYILFENCLYVAYNSSTLIKIDLSSEKFYICSNNNKEHKHVYKNLYTDGKRLYAVGTDADSGGIWELGIYDNKITAIELN